MLRPSPEIVPWVSDLGSSNGYPITAIAVPGRGSRGARANTWRDPDPRASLSTARSIELSTPVTVAPTDVAPNDTLSPTAPATTCAAVTMVFGPTMKPVPVTLPSQVCTETRPTPDFTLAYTEVKSPDAADAGAAVEDGDALEGPEVGCCAPASADPLRPWNGPVPDAQSAPVAASTTTSRPATTAAATAPTRRRGGSGGKDGTKRRVDGPDSSAPSCRDRPHCGHCDTSSETAEPHRGQWSTATPSAAGPLHQGEV
jgi:hypothetical protein